MPKPTAPGPSARSGRRGSRRRTGRDAIVIGAGPGGLTAAAFLAREGLDVLVLDRRSRPGGTCRAFSRAGHTFPCGPLGFSHPALVSGIMAELGAEPPGFRRVDYRLAWSGVDLVISRPFPRLAEDVRRLFPADAPGAESFFRDAASVACELNAAWEAARTPRVPEALKAPASEYLADRVTEPRLYNILGSMGTTPPGQPFPVLASAWELMAGTGIYYPEGGFDSFADALAGAAVSAGVEMRLGTGVSAIAAGDGAVEAVLDDGTVLDAGVLVSNADFKTTFLELLGRGTAPEEWTRRIASAGQTGSNVQVCLGLDTGLVDLAAFDRSTRIIYRSCVGPAPDRSAERIDPQALAASELELSLWSGDDPALAPGGGASLVIRAPAPFHHFARFAGEGGSGSRSGAYGEYKNALVEALTEEASSLLPGLPDAVRVVNVATPLTFHERGGRYDGAVAGWAGRDDGHDPCPVADLTVTPVKGLYMAGYQALSWLLLGGVPTAMLTGRMAASAALAGSGPLTAWEGLLP